MLRFLLFVAVLSLLGAAGFVWYVDRKVVSKLSVSESDHSPAVLSDLFELPAGEEVESSILTGELQARGYTNVMTAPKHPGEFGRITPDRLTVFARDIQMADGTVRAAQKGTLQIKGSRVIPLTPLLLEPLRIARLGEGEARASSFRPLKDIPIVVQHAVIAIEDERFYSHWGVDVQGIARAIVTNILAMRLVQGGSTITQQLAKNLLLSPEKTLGRKIFEVAAALGIERHYSKERILELYLNEVYLGQEGAFAIHGVAEASQTFFGKDLKEINAAEAALLAGIIQAPSAFSPRRNLARAQERQQLVISKMTQLGYLSSLESLNAQHTKLTIVGSPEQRSRLAAHYISALEKQLNTTFNVEAAERGGLSVHTGLHLGLQECAESAVDKGLAELEKAQPKLRKGNHYLEAGLVAIEPHSGKIRAWVGGRDYGRNQFDHVQLGRRQVGSTIKPFVYITALDSELNSYKPATPITILPDEPMHFESDTQPTWEPENFDRTFRGDVTLRYAIEHSLNMPSVYLGTRVGFSAIARTVKRFHLTDQVLAVPSLALGAIDTSLLNLTGAFGAIANGGIYVAPRLFTSAVDNSGSQLAFQPIVEERVAGEAPIYVLTNLMQGVVERGTATRVRTMGFLREVAGKTGTSNEARDAWFVGFVPNLVAGVWVGYDDNSPEGLTGGQAAVPIWTHFMKCAERYVEPLAFVPPPGVTFKKIDGKSGGLATPLCPPENITSEVFVQGTEPDFPCPEHTRYGEDKPISDAGSAQSDLGGNSNKTEEHRRSRGLWDVLFGD